MEPLQTVGSESQQRPIGLRERLLDLVLLAVVASAVLFPALGQDHHHAVNEILHSEIIREMAETGDYLETKLLGEPIYDKPPVMHAPAAFLMRLAGEPSMTITRLPSAVAGVLGVLVTYGLGVVLCGRRVALIGAIALLGIPGYSNMGRQARPDMIFCFAILMSCLGLALGMREQTRVRRALYFMVGGLSSGVAVLTKGPLGLLFAVLFAFLAPFYRQEWKRPRTGWLGFGLAVLAAAAVWIVPIYFRDHGVYLYHVIAQPDLDITQAGKSGPFLSYLWEGFGRSLPLSLFLPLALMDWRRHGSSAPLTFAGAIWLILTFIPKKRPHYLLPSYPFLALAIAASIVRHAPTSPLVRRAAWVIVSASVVAIPTYFAFMLPLIVKTQAPEMECDRAVIAAVEPNAHIYCLRDYEVELAWVRRSYDGIVQLGQLDRAAGDMLRKAPAPSYILISRPMADQLLENAGPLQVEQVMTRTVDKEERVLFRLIPRR